MDYIQNAVQTLESYATKVPLELLVLFGSFIEEVIAPIPSPLIMTLSDSIAKAQDSSIFLSFNPCNSGSYWKNTRCLDFVLYC